MNDALICAKDLHKHYMSGTRQVRAVNGVSLDIRRGRSLAIVGPSGAGKSTLLHVLGGLDDPTSGKVFIDGTDLYKLPDSDRSKIRNERIGFVFQFYHLLPEFTVLENVMLPAMIMCQSVKVSKCQRDIKQRAVDLLEAVGLKSRVTHRPNELSGGESQRAAIARALINGPEILLCDEPTGNLDSKTSESVYELLFALKEISKTALVIVTHDEKISSRTDDLIRIKDGRIA